MKLKAMRTEQLSSCLQHTYEMRARGLLKGGTVGVALIAHGWGWYEPDILHFEDDEPARRRIVDLTVRYHPLGPPPRTMISFPHL